MIPQNAVLLIIDVQKGFDEVDYWGGERNNPEAEENIATLLQAWRNTNRPVIYVQHLSTRPASPLWPEQEGCNIKEIVKPLPNEPVIHKQVNSAFIGTDLEQRLREMGTDTLVITGLTTDHCVSTTTRMAGNLGFKNYFVADGTATFGKVGYDGKRYEADVVHAVNLASVHREFANVVETQDVLNLLEQQEVSR